MKVKINDIPNNLKLTCVGADGSYQYNTNGNRSGHTFPFNLETQIGKIFIMSGNKYKIIGRRKGDE